MHALDLPARESEQEKCFSEQQQPRGVEAEARDAHAGMITGRGSRIHVSVSSGFISAQAVTLELPVCLKSL